MSIALVRFGWIVFLTTPRAVELSVCIGVGGVVSVPFRLRGVSLEQPHVRGESGQMGLNLIGQNHHFFAESIL